MCVFETKRAKSRQQLTTAQWRRDTGKSQIHVWSRRLLARQITCRSSRGPWPLQGGETPDEAKNRIVSQFKVYTSATATPKDVTYFSETHHAYHACNYLCQGSHSITSKVFSHSLHIVWCIQHYLYRHSRKYCKSIGNIFCYNCNYLVLGVGRGSEGKQPKPMYPCPWMVQFEFVQQAEDRIYGWALRQNIAYTHQHFYYVSIHMPWHPNLLNLFWHKSIFVNFGVIVCVLAKFICYRDFCGTLSEDHSVEPNMTKPDYPSRTRQGVAHLNDENYGYAEAARLLQS